MHEFEQWYNEINSRMISEHYHAVSVSDNLTHRIFEAWQDGKYAIADCIDVLHYQWVAEANRFAARLYEQVQQGVSFTVWHEFLASNRGNYGKA